MYRPGGGATTEKQGYGVRDGRKSEAAMGTGWIDSWDLHNYSIISYLSNIYICIVLEEVGEILMEKKEAEPSSIHIHPDIHTEVHTYMHNICR